MDAEHENHQLMSFILMEGLQLPELLPLPPAAYETVAEKYPTGASSFADGVPLLGGVAHDGRAGGAMGGEEEYDEYLDMY